MDFPFVREAVTKLFSKPSCNMYPFQPSEAAPNYRGRIVFHPETCINCNMCERVCAGGAITHTEEKTEEGVKASPAALTSAPAPSATPAPTSAPATPSS